jgi:hypothetical protein
MSNWNQPKCEACWIKDNCEVAVVEGEDVIVSIRMPVLLTHEHRDIKQCAWCGGPTLIGLFVRADPLSVPYPAPDEPEEEE